MRTTVAMMAIVLVVAPLLAAEPGTRPAETRQGEVNAPKAGQNAEAVKTFKAHLDQFTLALEYHGPQPTPPFLSLEIRTYEQRGDRSSLFPAVLIPVAQAEKVIDYLTKGDLFRCDARLYATMDMALPERYYMLSIWLRDDERPRYWLYLDMDRSLLGKLEALEAVLRDSPADAELLKLMRRFDPLKSEPAPRPSATQPATSGPATRPAAAISRERAVSIAAGAIVGKLDIPPKIEPQVSETAQVFVVTWPMHLAPGVRGPDYYARVEVDKETGKVRRMLGPS